MANPEPEWASQIIKYLKNGELPKDKEEAKKVKIPSNRYLLGDTLYKRSFTLPLLTCLFEEKSTMCSEKYTREYVGAIPGAKR